MFLHITTSAFVFGETTNNKHYSTQLKSQFLKYENILSQKLVKLELLHFTETVFEHSWCCRITLLFQVQDSVLREMRSNICVELFRNSVVHITEPLISSCVLFWKHNEVVSLSRRNNNSSDRIIAPPSFLAYIFGRSYANPPHIVM